MRFYHVERETQAYWLDRVTPWKVLDADGKVYAYCPDQAKAAHICSTMNFQEQWAMRESGLMTDAEIQQARIELLRKEVQP